MKKAQMMINSLMLWTNATRISTELSRVKAFNHQFRQENIKWFFKKGFSEEKASFERE